MTKSSINENKEKLIEEKKCERHLNVRHTYRSQSPKFRSCYYKYKKIDSNMITETGKRMAMCKKILYDDACA